MQCNAVSYIQFSNRISTSFPQLVCALSAYLLTVSVEGGSVSHTRRGKSSQAKKANKRSPDGHQAAPSVSHKIYHLPYLRPSHAMLFLTHEFA